MKPTGPEQLAGAEPPAPSEARQTQGVALAAAWQRALAGTGYVPLSRHAVRQQIATLAERVIALLAAEGDDPAEAAAIGADLARLYYGHPMALGRSQEVLARQFSAASTGGWPAHLAALLGGLAAGFAAEARRMVLAEQETIHAALLAAQRQAEELSRASEARFRAVFDAAAIGMGLGDIEGRILETNPALQALLGYDAEEFRRLTVTQFTHPEDTATDWALYEELVAGRRDHFQIEKRYLHKDGHIVWTRLTNSLVRDAAGHPQFGIAMIEDITARKQAEETIRQLNAALERRVLERTAQLTALNEDLASEVARRTAAESERLQLLTREQVARATAEAAQHRVAFLAEASAALASSLDYQVTLASVARLAVPLLADWCAVDVTVDDGPPQRLAVAHVDLTKLELVRALHAHHPPDPDALSGTVRVLRTGHAEFLADMDAALFAAVPGDATLQRILAELCPMSRITVPLVARGRTLGTMSFVLAESRRHYTPTDLHLAEELAQRSAIAVDNARLYQEAQRALAARDVFLSVAAHELKTPITNVRGFTELALRQFTWAGGPEPQRVERFLRALDRESLRLTHLVAQLLDISRIEAGQLAIVRAPTDLASLVREVASDAQLTTDRHTIAVRAPTAVAAEIDALRMQQVVANLLSNAIKYSPHGGPIDVEIMAPTPDTARIAVRDRGVGIAPDRRARLFDRFYQTREGDRVAGLGLGLYISRQIVNAHGGRIELESPPDGGTRVIIDLPAGGVRQREQRDS